MRYLRYLTIPNSQIMPDLLHLYNLDLEPTLHPSRRNKSTSPRRHRNPTEYLHMQKVAMIIRKQRAPNGIPRQPGKRNAKKNRSVPHPDLSDGRNLSNDGREHGDKCSGGEAVEDAENDDRCV